MPFPSYVPTVQVSAGGALVLESADQLELDVTFQASRGLTWQGTGMQFPNLGASADRSTAGGEVTWTLPATNVAGWLDLKSRSPIDVDGGERHTHSYTATIRILRGGKQAGAPVKIGPFVLPEGSGPVDLDTLIPAEGVQGQLISIPDQWSALVAEAQAAADGAADSAAAAEAAMVDSDEFIAGRINDPESATGVALTAQIGEVGSEAADAIGEYQWIYPQAIYVTTPSPRTLVGFIGADRGDGRSDVGVVVFDHLLRRAQRVVIGDAPTDDHNVPAIQQLPSGKLVLALASRGETNSNQMHVWATDESGDLATLGPRVTHNIGGSASYAQLHPDPTDPTRLFIMGRRWQNASPYDWYIARLTITDTGVSWGTIYSLLNSTVGRQPYITSVHSETDGVRLALTDNPSNGLNNVHYGSIDLETGDVHSPGKSISANVRTGAGLPLAFEDFDLAHTAGEGKELRTFAVRSGGQPAILCAAGNTGSTFASSAVYREVVRADSDDPGLHITGGTASVATPNIPAFDGSPLDLRIWIDVNTPAVSKGFIRKYVTAGNQAAWQFRTIASGALRFIWYPTGATTPNVTVDSSVVPNPDAIGYRVECDPSTGSGHLVRFYETLDGETWTQVGVDRTGAASSLFAGTAPIEIGGGTDAAQGIVSKVEIRVGGTLVASPDFRDATQWLDGATSGSTGIDAQGNEWTIGGAASIHGTGWQVADLGPSGAALNPSTPTYIGGLAYPVPSRGAVKYRSREASGVWQVEKVAAVAVALRPPGSRRLVRPVPVVGGGPFDVIVSDVDSYGGFSTFDSRLVGL
ncbi:hypothetical protein [Aeromicrobium piscarium]|uniref:Uncharacterized protein n=1 Tax=Aeromicrobium piscarium TaxID=2590901 RepID=A0A554SP62_9ACTN|nr:hypothetical protein [Aeromicrobium piscarium]TSD68146.1 hypothetical protein FNM00_00685 [Aeromicrobium piscarium]